jgi:hypothetical protein
MAATFEFMEDNGVATGSPAHGTTSTGARAEANWKGIDDSTTAYSASPVSAGNNSYEKYQYGHFTGSFSLISSGLWAHTAGALGSGLTAKGTVSSTYATPSTTANAALTTDMTAVIAIGSGLAVNFSTTGPYAAGPTSTLAAAGYSQYLIHQLQTTVAAAAGDTATATFTFQYSES